jgi:ABC-type uncharacterized transport system ATPase subunit
MPEILGLSDRVLVMRQGRIAGELKMGEISETAIVRLVMGLRDARPCLSPRQGPSRLRFSFPHWGLWLR